jgi:hypothetical protein
MLGPLVGMPSAHRGDPLSRGHVATTGRQRLLDFLDGGRVLQNGVVARSICQADDVHVAFDQTGHDGPAAKVDHARRGIGRRGCATNRNEASVANDRGVRNRVCRVHGVNAAVGEDNRRFGGNCRSLRCWSPASLGLQKRGRFRTGHYGCTCSHFEEASS